MSQENKKGFSSSFLLFLLGAVFLLFVLQSVYDKRTPHVAFNYQVEHLVNLSLIDPSYNVKSPQSDHVVTFSGLYRENLDKASKERFSYLELLHEQTSLLAAHRTEILELERYQKDVLEVGNLFLQVSGLPIPQGGYVLIGSSFDQIDLDIPRDLQRVNSIRILDVGPSSIKTVQQIRQMVEKGAPKSEVEQALKEVISVLLSQKFSLYAKHEKQKLEEAAQLTDLSKSLSLVESVIASLNHMEGDSRLNGVRSVRNYKRYMEQWKLTLAELISVQEKISVLGEKLKDFSWFYYDNEMKTRTLQEESIQDPDRFDRWFLQAKKEYEAFPENRGHSFIVYSQPRNAVLDKTFKAEEPTPGYISYFVTLIPVLLIALFIYFVFARQIRGVGPSAMNFGRSPAKLLNPSSDKVTFQDVAGINEVREELVEIVDFLKDSQKYIHLGAKIPKGVLLVGPPGTGKTLLAKAVAGEANCPFFSISGSDFVEMFVGVGASRVRDLFDQARKSAPCIVFIDEIDAVGRSRGHGLGGGNDEREQTLNQLLVELDGMTPASGIILIAATNRPDVLDKALLRPGRIDRQVQVSLPDVKGRLEILAVHVVRYKVDSSIDLESIAKMTVGFSGADLANAVNEAALRAAKLNRDGIYQADFEFAVDKIRFGKERNLTLDLSDIRATAYHEAGHAIVALCVDHSDPVERVTVIPRTRSLGHTAFRQKKDRLNYWSKEAIDMIAVLMGGQVAEEVYLQDISSGAKQDIQYATSLARSMVCEWGMNPAIGKVSYQTEPTAYGVSERPYSEETARLIDIEVKKLIDEGCKRAKEILTSHQKQVEDVVEALVAFETISNEDLIQIMEGRFQHSEKEKQLKKEEKLLLEGKGVAPSELKTFRPSSEKKEG